VARLTAEAPTEVEARVDGEPIGTALVSSGWTEARFDVPARAAAGPMSVSFAALGGRFGSAHYWLYDR
jgi:hypothetical protein